MRDVYLGNIVDITDPNCEFITEFDKETRKYGAIVYNYEQNSYQYVRAFNHINCKKEVLPDFVKVENTDPLLKGLNITIHYEFDPETEEDEENLEIWNEDISTIELPYYGYDEDGEIYEEKYIPISITPSKHTVWFLSEKSYEYILDTDLLMLTPIIKNINIARELIRNYAVHPFENQFKEDNKYIEPDLSGVYKKDEKKPVKQKEEKKLDFEW